MKYCPKCENILLPRKKKNVLYCRVCDKEFPVEKEDEMKEYKRSTKKRTEESRRRKAQSHKTVILEENIKKKSISAEERKAMEDLFQAPS